LLAILLGSPCDGSSGGGSASVELFSFSGPTTDQAQVFS
jgi:hypothetical protein